MWAKQMSTKIKINTIKKNLIKWAILNLELDKSN